MLTIGTALIHSIVWVIGLGCTVRHYGELKIVKLCAELFDNRGSFVCPSIAVETVIITENLICDTIKRTNTVVTPNFLPI